MLTIPTQDKLAALKLHGMNKAFAEQLAGSAEYEELTFTERLGLLVDREITARENSRLQTRLRQAKLRHTACLENIDYRHPRGLDKSLVTSLGQCHWITEHASVLITGPCGVGKSFIACALAHRACLHGHRVFYTRASRLFEDLAIAHGDGRYSKLLKSFARTQVLVIDDWGLQTLNEQQRMDLLEIMEDRHGIHSTIITSQLPLKHWHEIIGNPTLADAILDRLVHCSYKIELTGDSLRKKDQKQNRR